MSDQDKANDLQNQIDDLKGKAECATGDEKNALLSKVQDLENEKNQILSKIQGYEKDAQTVEGDVSNVEKDLHI